MDDRYDEMLTQLETISERLGDRSIELLQEAIANGATSRPAEDKLLARARRSVDKAITLLREASGDDTGSVDTFEE